MLLSDGDVAGRSPLGEQRDQIIDFRGRERLIVG